MTGGTGLLGREILKIDPSIIAPPRQELDITDLYSVEAAIEKHRPEIVLHLAAATKPPEHTKNPEIGIKTNIIGTANLALTCHLNGIRIAYTSTDYVYAGDGPHKESEPLLPPYAFGWSKLGGESSIMMIPNSLVMRLSFGPVPFPWDSVYEGQFNSKLYVDEMAPLVLAAAKSSATGILNIGGPRTTLEAYAKRSRPGIKTIPKPDWVPKDTSLDLSKMKKELGISDESSVLKR